jgi:hypothetical protein
MSFHIPLASAPGVGQADAPDFVTGDMAALAAHMQRCAHARGKLFKMRGGLQTVHAMAASRIVTLACLAVVLAIALLNIV